MERSRVLRRPHFLSNANTALQFLASRRIKLVNINAADLVDGRPPVVLGLIWTIILYFQVIGLILIFFIILIVFVLKFLFYSYLKQRLGQLYCIYISYKIHCGANYYTKFKHNVYIS